MWTEIHRVFLPQGDTHYLKSFDTGVTTETCKLKVPGRWDPDYDARLPSILSNIGINLSSITALHLSGQTWPYWAGLEYSYHVLESFERLIEVRWSVEFWNSIQISTS